MAETITPETDETETSNSGPETIEPSGEPTGGGQGKRDTAEPVDLVGALLAA